MTSEKHNLTIAPEVLFGRVVSILEQARANVVRSFNAWPARGCKRRCGSKFSTVWKGVVFTECQFD